MSKVVLVMDMPECCADCPCSFFERDNPELNLICGATGEDANNVGKPGWCPLVPVPEKKPCAGVDGIKSILLDERIKEGIKEAGAFGWNACIDAITGEKEGK